MFESTVWLQKSTFSFSFFYNDTINYIIVTLCTNVRTEAIYDTYLLYSHKALKYTLQRITVLHN